MLTVELSADDLENNGQYAKIGGVARAIAKAKGVSNLLNSERKIFPRINAGVQSGALNPIDPETLEPLSKSNYGNGLVNFDELAEWGRSRNQFDFRIPASVAQNQPEIPKRFPAPAPQKVGAGDTAKETPAERRAKLDITAERGSRRRILEHWDSIEKEYGPNADGRQVWRVLKRDKGEDVPELKTVQNRLSDLRAEKLIP